MQGFLTVGVSVVVNVSLATCLVVGGVNSLRPHQMDCLNVGLNKPIIETRPFFDAVASLGLPSLNRVFGFDVGKLQAPAEAEAYASITSGASSP